MLPASAMAQATGSSVTSFGVGEWFSLVLRLGLVIGVIWAAVYAMRWYTRRAGGERGSAARALDIVETRSLGPNRTLHLVRIGGRAVLIGVTPERINALLEINDPEVLDSLGPAADGPSRPATAFSALMAGLGAGGHVTRSAPAPAPASGRVSRDASWSGFWRGLRRPHMPAPPRRWPRPSVDRVLTLLGFTPVESIPQAVERMRAARLAAAGAPAAPKFPAAMAMPAPRGAGASAPSAVVAPSATQTLRALSGYRAAQQSSQTGLTHSSDREERIAEAQRAIAAARQKTG